MSGKAQARPREGTNPAQKHPSGSPSDLSGGTRQIYRGTPSHLSGGRTQDPVRPIGAAPRQIYREGVAVISKCARYRITVSPGDDGAVLTLWHWPIGAGCWHLQGSIELALPFHLALDHAYAAVRDTPAAPDDWRRGTQNKGSFIE